MKHLAEVILELPEIAKAAPKHRCPRGIAPARPLFENMDEAEPQRENGFEEWSRMIFGLFQRLHAR